MALAKLSAYQMICSPIAGRKSYRTTSMFYWVATKLKRLRHIKQMMIRYGRECSRTQYVALLG